MKIKKVYIASPLFNPKELELNQEIDDILRRAGYETFLPQRDGFLYVELLKQIKKVGCSDEEAERIALNLITHLDVYEVCEDCDATVLNLNGRVPDEGGVTEGGLSFRSEKPLVIYKQDSRSLIMGKDNPLITGLTGFNIVNKVDDIPLKLKELESLIESAYSRMIKTARLLFKDYDPQNKNLEALARMGGEYFLKG
ncbi:nucleoside 2-deoxyribosyltransferase [Candidatus Woesearchaeota archaeon]|nr:nucleoside 2-deoxyribosyltransferase [Candidatus Woesearchaeota archaeon]